jgi:hypothetical protein
MALPGGMSTSELIGVGARSGRDVRVPRRRIR